MWIYLGISLILLDFASIYAEQVNGGHLWTNNESYKPSKVLYPMDGSSLKAPRLWARALQLFQIYIVIDRLKT